MSHYYYQVALVEKFVRTAKSGGSICHQMIMGAGKTTVICPLLALMLGDGRSLVVEVVPQALVDFSRTIMRSRFAAIMPKPIYTFKFDRFAKISPNMHTKLVRARDAKAVVVTTPTALKSFLLKFIESVRQIDQDHLQGKGVNPELRSQITECARVLQVFRESTLILDEIDSLLHPLKSELNWPLGEKDTLDFTKSKSGDGLRFEIPFHLIDAILYASSPNKQVPSADSQEAIQILEKLEAVIAEGVEESYMQRTPHLVLLSKRVSCFGFSGSVV